MKKVEFIAFSDIHVEDWKRFSTNHSRLHTAHIALQRVAKAARDNKCPTLFCGDFFHNPQELSNLVISSTFINYHRNMGDIEVYGISGNHDQSESNSVTHKSPSHLDLYDYAFDNFNLLDGVNKLTQDGRFLIHGIPYLKSNVGFVSKVKEARGNIKPGVKNILLVHTDFHNIKYNNKRSSGTVENLPRQLNKLFKGFDLVLSGHIHKSKVIRNNVLMLGATNHQKLSDVGIRMGYWKIYSDLTYKFVKLNLPEFKFGKDLGDGNFYTPKPKKIKKLEVSSSKSFVGNNLGVLAKNYLLANNVKDKSKYKYLKKYLYHGLS